MGPNVDGYAEGRKKLIAISIVVSRSRMAAAELLRTKKVDEIGDSTHGAIGRPLTPAFFAISALLSKLRALFYNVANLRSR